MQKKPNFRNDKMNITYYISKKYDELSLRRRRKNKANSKPIQSQTNPIDPNFGRKILYEYAKQTQSNPIKEWSQSLRQLLLTEYGCNFGVNNLFLDDNIVWSYQGSRIRAALRFEQSNLEVLCYGL